MSFAQEQTWLGCRTRAGSLAYNLAYPLRIRGALDVDTLQRSVDTIVARHEMLRTTFEERDGRPVQVVHPLARIELQLVDLRHGAQPLERAEEILDREIGTPFDLQRGPLLRLWLLRIGELEHQLLRVNHHIISDARSWRVFFGELAELYEARVTGRPAVLPELQMQYGDFAVRERRRLDPQSSLYRDEVDWWATALDAAPEPMILPFARSAPEPNAKPADGVIRWGLEPEVAGGLDRLRKESGASYFTAHLAAFSAHLALESEREDMVLGTMISRRSSPEMHPLFGFFSEVAMIRIAGAHHWSFRQWLMCVRAVMSDTRAHTELPFPELTRELRDRGVNVPPIEIIFASVEVNPAMSFGGLTLDRLNKHHGSMPWELTFNVDRWRESDGFLTTFNACKHDPVAVRSFIEGYKRLALAVGAEPDRPVRELVCV
jgi:Condensation domain